MKAGARSCVRLCEARPKPDRTVEKFRLRLRGRAALSKGGVRPSLIDILAALILLAILLYAAWTQFPAYERRGPEQSVPARESDLPFAALMNVW